MIVLSLQLEGENIVVEPNKTAKFYKCLVLLL